MDSVQCTLLHPQGREGRGHRPSSLPSLMLGKGMEARGAMETAQASESVGTSTDKLSSFSEFQPSHPENGCSYVDLIGLW